MTVELHCGDSVEVMRTMADNSVDAVVTDPPYGLSEHRHSDVVACLTAWLAGEEFKPRKKGFMGRAWDAWVPGPEVFREALRVAKPGAHMLVFAGTRSMDLMMMAVRLAGWEIRDSIGHAHDAGDPTQPALMAWAYGSGFPKNMDVSKAIDDKHFRDWLKANPEHAARLKEAEDGVADLIEDELRQLAGAKREVIGEEDTRSKFDGRERDSGKSNASWRASEGRDDISDVSRKPITAPSTDAAKQWAGWGTALKPAWEPIIIARKPLDGTVAANVLKYGTGAYNIDACRIETDEDLNGGAYAEVGGREVSGSMHAGSGMNQAGKTTGREFVQPTGRWPANLIHDGSEAVVDAFPSATGSKGDVTGNEPSAVSSNTMNARARVPYTRQGEASGTRRYGAGGNDGFAPTPGARRDAADSAARFFYCAKTSSADRHEGMQHPGHQFKQGATLRDAEHLDEGRKGNKHPTVKPTPLMRYLTKLVTPPGGRVLDFCMGSGSTGKAAELEGFSFVGIDIDPENVDTARARIGADAPLFQEAA